MRHSAALEWEFLEQDEAAWAQVLATRPADAAPRTSARRQLLAIAGMAIVGAAVLLAVIGAQLWHAAQEGIVLIENDARTLVKFETMRRNAQTPDSHVATTVNSIAINGSGIMVRVVITETDAQGSAGAFTASRFYTRAGDRWQSSQPLASFWGRDLTLDSDHFHLVFRDLDRAAVEAAAGPLDDCLGNLRAQLGLRPLTAAERITLTVAASAELPGLGKTGSEILLPSPLLLNTPADSTGAAALLTEAYPALLSHTLKELQGDSAVNQMWGAVILDLYAWLMKHPQAVPACHPKAENVAAASRAPCAIATDSMLVSIDTTYLSPPTYDDHADELANVIMHNKDIFFAYLTSGKSRATLPQFLAALPRHKEWTTLIPDVFGMSKAALQCALQCPSG